MKQILLVEDDPLIAEIYMTKLREAGFSVERVSDGEDALKLLQRRLFDLLILDLVLPQLTGLEILKKIRKDKKLKRLNVMVVSNLGQKTDMQLAEELGVLKYLIKANFTPSEIVKEIKQLLK